MHRRARGRKRGTCSVQPERSSQYTSCGVLCSVSPLVDSPSNAIFMLRGDATGSARAAARARSTASRYLGQRRRGRIVINDRLTAKG